MACRVVLQGGWGDLAGGAMPTPGEIAIAMERMCSVEALDTGAGTMTVPAGTVLQHAQAATGRAGPASCPVGGNRVIRYGVTRHAFRASSNPRGKRAGAQTLQSPGYTCQ